MRAFIQDFRYGIRTLLRSPGFTALVVVSLALGIGANTSIFSMVKAVVLRPLPGVQDAQKLVMLMGLGKTGRFFTFSYPNYKDFRDRNEAFSALIATSTTPLSLSGESGPSSRPERVWGELVTGNYFSVLGVNAVRGRTITPEDDGTPGAHPVAVVSYGLWQRRFGSDPNLVGKTIRLNGHPFTAIGVASPGFGGSTVGLTMDVFVPMMTQAQVIPLGDWLNQRDTGWLIVLGRLKPGVSLGQAQAEAKTIARQLEQEHPQTGLERGYDMAAFPLSQAPFGARKELSPVLALLMAVVGLVLLIACANVTNLLLARGAGRRREIAIRLALGAGRWRVARQLLTESLLLALLAGVAGVLLALWATDLLSTFRPPSPLPIAIDTSLDGRVLAFTTLISLATGLLFGLAPALRTSRPDLVTALKDEASAGGYRKSRLRSLLVIGQLSLSLVSLIAAGLLLRGLNKARQVNAGFDPSNVLLTSLDLHPLRYSESQGRVFYRQMLERLSSLPGVRSASLASLVPLGIGQRRCDGVEIPGYTPRRDEDMCIDLNVVGPSYLQTMGIPLVRGREFNLEDTEDHRAVAVINEAIGRRFWPGQDPIGKTFVTAGRSRVVIGVARDSKYLSLRENALPYIYLPLLQQYEPMMTLHVKTAGDPMSLLVAVRGEIQSMNPDLPLFEIRTLAEHMGGSVFGERMASTMLGVFGALALLLASVGLYGVMSYAVSQRTHEVGVRMALGAEQGDILRLILRQGLMLVLMGIGVGVAAAWAVSRFLSGFLYGVSATDLATFAGVSTLLAAVAMLACYLPARRATKVDPMTALRYE
ncbi:MAG: ABC transporter permease [Acidobacteria bacterium]|nr:ABC transporter permease [Acidobacteriota bacterium]